MSPRMGRPPKDNPLSIVVKVRIDADTNDRLKAYCSEHQVTRTEVIRQGIEMVINKK